MASDRDELMKMARELSSLSTSISYLSKDITDLKEYVINKHDRLNEKYTADHKALDERIKPLEKRNTFFDGYRVALMAVASLLGGAVATILQYASPLFHFFSNTKGDGP